MKSEQTTLLLRHALLLQLAASTPVALPESTLAEGLRIAGYNTLENELRGHLIYLEEKGCINQLPSELSAGLRRYRISAAGRDYLEREALI